MLVNPQPTPTLVAFLGPPTHQKQKKCNQNGPWNFWKPPTCGYVAAGALFSPENATRVGVGCGLTMVGEKSSTLAINEIHAYVFYEPAQVRGFQTSGGIFSGEKKAPAATYPQVRGFQDLGTKKKRRAREAEPLSMQGGTWCCRPPASGSGGLEAPQEEQGVRGAAAPQ